jgi:hypothetical protein
MVSYDTNARISDILKGIEQVKARVDQLIEVVKPEKDLWDNFDIIRNWHISQRTLAEYRRKGLIGFVKVGGKIINVENARD